MHSNLKRKPLAEAMQISGSKGGETSRQSVESPDSLFSIAQARIIDLVSEGEIEGFPHGADFLQDCYFDETPVQNADGTRNFKNFQVDARTGTQDQTYIPGFPAVENELAVGVELNYGSPWTRSFTNKQLSAVRVRIGVNALSKTDETSGDVTGYSVGYAIDVATDGGAFVEVCQSAMTGKASSAYERGHRIELPTSTVSGWIIRVRRLTPDSTTQYIVDGTSIVSVTEIIDGKFRYPMSALVGVQIDASQFSSIPTRAYHLKGRKVKVPANYNPTTRTYATTGTGTTGGSWDGTFKTVYSNNPAWVFYDMTTHKRYGLGRLVDELLIDKWALYNIAQYCDEMVPDGFGGTEPRMTCNLYLQRAADAWKVVGDLSSIFRGICYWAGGTIIPVADRPSDPVYTYTNSNVVDGVFRYESSGRRARHTAVIVSYNDMSDFARLKADYYDDPEGIARFGFQLAEIVALGCTSRGQAQRFAKWLLYSEKLLTNTVSFSVGIDGTFAVPGQIVRIADQWRAGRRIGGRIASATASQIVVDALPDPAPMAGDTAIATLPNGVTESRTVSSVVGNGINVSVPWSAIPVAESVWAVESSDLYTQLFRILSCKESEEDGSHAIFAMQHNVSIFDAVDFGEAISVPPISVVPSPAQQRPSSVTITSVERAGEVVAMSLLMASWPKTPGAVKYQIQWRKDQGEWTTPQTVNGTTADYQTPFAGSYEAKVVAISAIGVVSVPQYSSDYALADQIKKPGFVEALNADIAEALTTAQNAQASADGSIITFWQDTAPTIGAGAGLAKEGDIWFDTNDGNSLWRVVGSVWVDATDDDIAEALAIAAGAQATADGKVRTYFSDTAPAGAKSLGDLWFDTNDNILYRWDGTDWSQRIGDITLDQIAGSGINILWNEYVTYNSSLPTITPIYGGPGPTYSAGDNAVGGGGSLSVLTATTSLTEGYSFGVSSTDYNLPILPGRYIASFFVKCDVAGHKVAMNVRKGVGGTYETMPDYTVINANTWERASGVIDLRGVAGLKAALPGIFTNRSGVAGRTVKIDGLMLEPMVGNMEFPSGFTAGKAGKQALTAIANAAYAQATADGKIETYFQAAIPATGSEGDLWFDTDDGNKIYTYQSGAWVATPDSRIAQAIADAAGAQATADSKVTTFYQETTPTATGIGDLWYQESTKSLYRWDGTTWGNTVEGVSDSPLNVVKKSNFEDGNMGSWGPGNGVVVTAALGAWTKQIQLSGSIYESDGWFRVRAGESYNLSCMLNGNGHGSTGYTRMIIHCLDSAGGTTGFIEACRQTGTGAGTISGNAIVPANSVIARVAFFVGGASFSWSRFTDVQCVKNLDSVPPGDTYTTGYVGDYWDNAGIRRHALLFGASGVRIGDARNLIQSQVNAYGSVRTTGSLSATSGGAISVLAHTVRNGATSISYNAVSNAVTGKAQGSSWVIYCRDPDFAGGTRTWFAAASAAAAMNIADDVVIAGVIQIPTSGTSTGGEGGSGPPSSYCVDWDSVLPDGRLVRDLKPGDLVLCIDVRTGETGWYPLLAMDFGEEDCYRLVSEGLCSVVQSKSTPMDLPDGSVLRTPEMFGKPIYHNPKGKIGRSHVADLEHVGRRKVCKPDLGNRMFFAGETADGTLATHNIIWKP